MKTKIHLLTMLLFMFCGCDTETKNTNSDNREIVILQGTTSIANKTGKFDFGNIFLGKSSQEVTFTIKNTGSNELVLSGNPDMIQKINEVSGSFNIKQNLVVSPVHPDNTTSFSISFEPTSIGVATAIIQILNSSENKNPYTFYVEGTGIGLPSAPEIKIEDSSANNIGCGVGSFDFGSCAFNTLKTETFTIQNLGSDDLNLTGTPVITISGSDAALFTINQSMTTSPIFPGNSTTFDITFETATPGSKSAVISINNNDADENPFEFELKGEGISPYGWTKRMGGTDTDFGYSISLDSSSNIFVTGGFGGTVNFGSDFGVSDVKTSTGLGDVFVTKINANGTYGWTKKMGGTDSAWGSSIALDSSGNIYVTGNFSGTVNFGADFGVSDVKTSTGYQDIFVTKINANGTYSWTKRMDGASYSITTDSSGNIFVTGCSLGTAASNDIFVTKINANGTNSWTKKMGGTDNDWASSIIVDSSGNIFVTGSFLGTVNFGADFGMSDVKTSTGGDDIFVTKINANGTYSWTKRMGGTGSDWGSSIALDSSGNIYVTGKFVGSVNFGADFGVSDAKTSAGSKDIFVTKFYR